MTETTYDSRPDTWEHIHRVQYYMKRLIESLHLRAHLHDQSKLRTPEKELLDVATPLLKDLTYGSPEYKNSLAYMSDGIKHHYEHNRHHPQYHDAGINDMTLVDLVEMVCDWTAARERGKNNEFLAGMEINRQRYNIDNQLFQIILNTCEEYGLD